MDKDTPPPAIEYGELEESEDPSSSSLPPPVINPPQCPEPVVPDIPHDIRPQQLAIEPAVVDPVIPEITSPAASQKIVPEPQKPQLRTRRKSAFRKGIEKALGRVSVYVWVGLTFF
eukprot:sb/3476670/